MHLQGAIFDMDGTLLDSVPAWQSLFSDLLAAFGCQPEPGLSRIVQPMGLTESTAYLKTHYGLSQTQEELANWARERMGRFYREEVRAKPGAEAFLSLLKLEGVWMYLATATDRPLAEAAMRRAGLDGYFRGILTCEDVHAGKDQPVIFERCLTRLRCRKADCVVFEDSPAAIQTAKAAGFRVAAVYDPSFASDRAELEALADYYIRDYSDWITRE